MGYGVRFRVWGDYACFTRPELKVERVSYDMLTPTAARGILESIYWKPAIQWHIKKIHVLNPIEFTNIRRNEVSEVLSMASVKRAMAGSGKWPQLATTQGNRQQRAAIVLKNVEYVIEAYFELTEKAGETDTVEKHYKCAATRLREGRHFRQPCLGTREFSAHYELIEDGESVPISALHGEQDLGYMLFDLGYQLNDKKDALTVTPSFFRAVLVDGVLDLEQVREVL